MKLEGKITRGFDGDWSNTEKFQTVKKMMDALPITARAIFPEGSPEPKVHIHIRPDEKYGRGAILSSQDPIRYEGLLTLPSEDYTVVFGSIKSKVSVLVRDTSGTTLTFE